MSARLERGRFVVLQHEDVAIELVFQNLQHLDQSVAVAQHFEEAARTGDKPSEEVRPESAALFEIGDQQGQDEQSASQWRAQ